QGYYYAETAANYMQWILKSDAELDSYASYPGGYLRQRSGLTAPYAPFGEPCDKGLTTMKNIGDFSELAANLSNPGPITISDTGSGASGAVMYFDNSPLANPPPAGRAIKWPDAKAHPPSFENISARLPRYIKIDIDAYGNIAPTIPQLPHVNPPVVGEDIPQIGALAWLTAGVADDYGEFDVEIVPMDAYTYNAGCTAAPNPNPMTTVAGLVCGSAPFKATDLACDTYTNAAGVTALGWVGPARYRFVIYALGYVNGKPVRLVRKTW
ncbi:MAG: hypothetical protein Q9M09_03595, partial [Mariprofundaceae bacterium]|nr:hypothetical protein [Mariprofundaceae bacterium]